VPILHQQDDDKKKQTVEMTGLGFEDATEGDLRLGQPVALE
jgi:hypothetical protein